VSAPTKREPASGVQASDEKIARGYDDAMLRGELSLAESTGDVRPSYLAALAAEYERRWPTPSRECAP